MFHSQVPVHSPDDISQQSIWLPSPSYYCQVVYWFSSWSVPYFDLHVPEPDWWFGWEPTLCWSEKFAGSL